jgi:hypothetical protein
MTAVGKNTAAKKAIEKDIEEINFREVAQDVIKKYFDKGMILDGVLWGRIIGLYEKVLNRPQPMQPIEILRVAGSNDYRARFRPNAIVKRLFEAGHFELNVVQYMDVPVADREQFWQLLGYSIDDFGALSWVRQETKDAADLEAAKLILLEKEKEENGPT